MYKNDIGSFSFRGARFGHKIAQFCLTFSKCLRFLLVITGYSMYFKEINETAF
jgi:hypothetical protein